MFSRRSNSNTYRSLKKSLTRKHSSPGKLDPNPGLKLEALERRLMLSADPLLTALDVVPPPDDNYEENDWWNTAYDLSSHENTLLSSIDGMGIQLDEDWYEIYVNSGFEYLEVELSFTHADGDINLTVLDSGLNNVTHSASTDDNEYIDYVLPSSGTYYLRVTGDDTNGNKGNEYDLWWDDVPNFEEYDDFPPFFTVSTFTGEAFASGISISPGEVLDFGVAPQNFSDSALEQSFRVDQDIYSIYFHYDFELDNGEVVVSDSAPTAFTLSEELFDSELDPGEPAYFAIRLDTSELNAQTGTVTITYDVYEDYFSSTSVLEEPEFQNSFEFTVVAFVNDDPVAEAGVDQTVDEGAEVEFNGTFTDENDRGVDPVTFEWDFGDGSPKLDTQNATYTYSDEGTYVASFTVTDAHGGEDTDTMTVTVINAAPTADPGNNAFRNTEVPIYSIMEGEDLLLDGSGSSDPGNDPLMYSWTIDGNDDIDSDEIVLVPWSFLEGLGVNDNIVSTINLEVNDGQDGIHDQDVELHITNVLPTADAGGAYTINEGEALGLDASGTSDPNANDILTYKWYLNDDGIVDAEGVNPIVEWGALEALGLTTDGRPREIKLVVSDGSGDSGGDFPIFEDTAWLAINNLAAKVDADGPYTVYEGTTDVGGGPWPLTLKGTATDLDGNDTFSYAWDLDNDGNFGEDNEPKSAGPVASGVEFSDTVTWANLVDLVLPSDGTELTIWLRVDDGQGGPEGQGGMAYAHTTLTIDNLAPFADAGGNDVIYGEGEREIPIYRIFEGEDLELEAKGLSVPVEVNADSPEQFDPDIRDVVTFSWDLDGDGDYEITSHPTSDYTVPWSTLEALIPPLSSDGTPSTIGLRVDDGEGGVSYAYVDLYIDNLDPHADIGGIDEEIAESPVYVILNEGEDLFLDGSGSWDPGNDPLTYFWAFGNMPVNSTDEIDYMEFYHTDEYVLVPWSFLEMIGVQGKGLMEGIDGIEEFFEDFLIYLEVDDGQGGSDFADAELLVFNVAPTADAGGAYTIDEGEALGLDASGTSDPNANDELTYAWDLDNDGAYDDAFGVNPIVSWAKLESLGLISDGGPFPISLKVNDDVDYGTDTTWLAINNLPAAVDAGGPYTFDEGDTGTLELEGSATDLDVHDNLTFAWDLNNDGIFGDVDANEPTGATPNVTTWENLVALGLPSDGTELTIWLRVDDGDGGPLGQGGMAYAHTTLTIINQPPVAVTGDYTIVEGEELPLDASASIDPDLRDISNLTFSWDLDNDGDYEYTADPAGTHTVPWSALEALVPPLTTDGEPQTISVRVDDGEGGVSTAEATLIIENAAPTADPNGPYTIFEGEDFLLDGSGSWDPGNDPLTFEWTIDGADVPGTGEFVFVPWSFLEAHGVDGDGSALIVTLGVADGEGGTDTQETTLTINNLDPTADVGGPYSIIEGDPVTLDAGDSTDPNANDILTYKWDLDGNGVYGEAAKNEPTGVNPTVSWAILKEFVPPHSTNSVPHVIGVQVTDDDGGVNTDMTVLIINNVPPTVDAGPDLYNLMGTEAIFDGDFSDPAGNLDTYTFLWDFGDGITAETLDATHTYTASGLYTVSLTVTDSDLGQITDVLEITVEEQIPVIDGKAIWHNLSGTVIVTLTGPGELELYHINGLGIDFNRIVLTDTTDESKLKFKTAGVYSHFDGGTRTAGLYSHVVLGDITVNSSLGRLVGTTATLQGDFIVNEGSLGNLKLNDIADYSTIETASPAPKGFRLKAHDVGDGVNFKIADYVKDFRVDDYKSGSLTANSIDKLVVKKGDLGADVFATLPIHELSDEFRGIGKVIVRGDIKGAIESATSIKQVISNNGGLTGDALIFAHGDSIGQVKVRGDIEGAIESATSIKRVISSKGGLLGDAVIFAHEGSIGQAMFATNVEGTVLASEKIGKVSSADGTLSGILRAGEKINKVRFNEIESALVSSGGDINKIYSDNSIVDTALMAGYDIGPDGLPGTGDDIFDTDGAFTIGKIRVNPKTGNFFGSQAAAGVKPFGYDTITGTWTILAPEGHTQELAVFGKIGSSSVGQVYLNGEPDFDVYGLFAATEVGKVKLTEIAGAGAPDFEIIWNWT